MFGNRPEDKTSEVQDSEKPSIDKSLKSDAEKGNDTIYLKTLNERKHQKYLRLLVKEEQSFVQDPLHDDASLLIETSSGPVILTGCAHSAHIQHPKYKKLRF